MYDNSGESGFSNLGLNGGLSSPLVQMLMAPEIVPGEPPSYQLCKTIFAYHPLGATLAAAPVTQAQSQARQISVPDLGEARIVKQFTDTWDSLGGRNSLGRVSATDLIHNVMTQSRIYGIASLVIGERDGDPMNPLDINKVGEADLFFNVLDPLNTAGSLVLNQDPNSPDFLKARAVAVAGKEYHPSRTFVKMHEQALYIEWSPSAFGFVGRSIYQRALFPLKSYIQTMITDQLVAQKAGLLVAKMESPGSIIDQVMQTMFGFKRGQIKAGVTGQVLGIGVSEEIESLNLQNLDKAGEFARTNILKNIATAAGMPAAIVANETLTEGFGEGTEDAKMIARYLDYVRQDMAPLYAFIDRVVMRKAWTPEFYETMRTAYPEEYGRIPYETALYRWIELFKATWPNLLTEPDSEKTKTADVQLKAVVAIVEVLMPALDPEAKANLIAWVADNVNEKPELFAGKLDIDVDALQAFLEQNAAAAKEATEEAEIGEEEPTRPKPFSAAS